MKPGPMVVVDKAVAFSVENEKIVHYPLYLDEVVMYLGRSRYESQQLSSIPSHLFLVRGIVAHFITNVGRGDTEGVARLNEAFRRTFKAL